MTHRLSMLGRKRRLQLAKERAESDISTSRALPNRPMIYRLRIDGERTRALTLEAVLTLSASIVLLPRSIECEPGEA